MGQKQLIQQLKQREEELNKELSAIRVLISSYEDEDGEEIGINRTSNISDNVILPKGNKNWEDYSIYLLDKLGGEAKASKVAELAVQANPGIDPKTVQTAVKGKLSKNYREGRIDATKSRSRKDGFLYKTKMRRTKF